jgi:hypothetical protein
MRVAIAILPSRPLHAALTLSGGGAKGSFEVGALQFLYSRGFFCQDDLRNQRRRSQRLATRPRPALLPHRPGNTALLGFWNAISPANPFLRADTLADDGSECDAEWSHLGEGGIEAIDLIVLPIGGAKFASVLGSTIPWSSRRCTHVPCSI